jgi:hypothetical protein
MDISTLKKPFILMGMDISTLKTTYYGNGISTNFCVKK